MSELARTFLRTADDRLYVGIYYSNWLIEQLEKHDPRGGLSNSNIQSLIMFVEEINHALHAALQFKAGLRRIDSEDFARNLELQGMVDTYLVLLLFVAFFRKTQRISRTDRRWLRFHLFESRSQDAFRDENLRARYLETGELASSYTHYLDTLNGARRLDEIRNFHALTLRCQETTHPGPDESTADHPSKRKLQLLLPFATGRASRFVAEQAGVQHASTFRSEADPFRTTQRFFPDAV